MAFKLSKAERDAMNRLKREALVHVKNQDVTLYRGYLIRRSPFGHGFIPEKGGFKHSPKPTLADAKRAVDDVEG